MTKPLGVVFALLVGSIAAGCATDVVPEIAQARQAKYQRIAFVCAPAEDADPSYKPMMLSQVDVMKESRLNFVAVKDVVAEGSVDLSGATPKPALPAGAGPYDGIVTLIYSYGDGWVHLDIDMIDTETGESVWHFRDSTEDPDIPHRLNRHAYWACTKVKTLFYGYAE